MVIFFFLWKKLQTHLCKEICVFVLFFLLLYYKQYPLPCLYCWSESCLSDLLYFCVRLSKVVCIVFYVTWLYSCFIFNANLVYAFLVWTGLMTWLLRLASVIYVSDCYQPCSSRMHSPLHFLQRYHHLMFWFNVSVNWL